MKQLMIALTLAGFAVTGSAFAQSTTSGSTANNTAKVASSTAPSTASNATTGQWTPPYGQTVAPKTRAQVYQELVQAEKDGQLAYLNSTVYAHP